MFAVLLFFVDLLAISHPITVKFCGKNSCYFQAIRGIMNKYMTAKKGCLKLDIQVGDVLRMKKPHPCGEHHFLVLRVGMDFKLRCVKCGRELMIPRAKAEKYIREVTKKAD